MNLPRFECDQCGACCNGHLIVEADELDLLREPRLIEADRFYQQMTVPQALHLLQNDVGRAIHLSCGQQCKFLGEDKKCSIYPTRPNVCVGMQAGDEQCQEARQAAGLPPLSPLSVPEP
jgi:Fe-S-cluster containining protein